MHTVNPLVSVVRAGSEGNEPRVNSIPRSTSQLNAPQIYISNVQLPPLLLLRHSMPAWQGGNSSCTVPKSTTSLYDWQPDEFAEMELPSREQTYSFAKAQQTSYNLPSANIRLGQSAETVHWQALWPHRANMNVYALQ